MQAVDQQDLLSLQFDPFGRYLPAFFEAVNGFLDRVTFEQLKEVPVHRLDIHRLRRFVISVVNPIGWVLYQRPEIIIQV